MRADGSQPNIAQALHLLNGDFLNKKIAAPTGRIETLLKAKKPLPDDCRGIVSGDAVASAAGGGD